MQKEIFFFCLAKRIIRRKKSIRWTSQKVINSKISETGKYYVQEHFGRKRCEVGFANLRGILN